MRRRPSSTLFPYTTLFRSLAVALARIRWARVLVELVRGKRSAEGVHRDLHGAPPEQAVRDRKSTRLNSSHGYISYAVFCLKKKNYTSANTPERRTFHTTRP